MKLAVLLTAFVLLPAVSLGGTISCVVTSEKTKLKEHQKRVVVWVEGITPGDVPKKKAVLSQSGLQFSPRVLTVVAGQTVEFPNKDDVAHNVFSLSKAKKFKLGIYPKGQSREVTFTKPGVIDLFCSIHRHMHAVVVVTPTSHAAEGEMDKPFTIKDVPAGEYTVKAWNSRHKLSVKKIVVPESGEVKLQFNLGK